MGVGDEGSRLCENSVEDEKPSGSRWIDDLGNHQRTAEGWARSIRAYERVLRRNEDRLRELLDERHELEDLLDGLREQEEELLRLQSM